MVRRRHAVRGEGRLVMRFAINIPPFGEFADARVLADLAARAEASGWDGFFIWDHVHGDRDVAVADPTVALTAVAAATSRIRFGAMVTPLPRRSPWKVAREAVTLDRLSGGRLILGVGSGSDRWYGEHTTIGFADDDQTRAETLDESLDIVAGLWTGEPLDFSGRHFTIRDARFLPVPVQKPRIPIWVGGMWPRRGPLERAARWDGYAPGFGRLAKPEDVRAVRDRLIELRPDLSGFDLTVVGVSALMRPEEVAPRLAEFEEAGVTWWQEGFLGTDTAAEVKEYLKAGPPGQAA